MRKRTFYWACIRLAVKGTWGVIGDVSTLLGPAVAAFWHFHQDAVNDPAIISKVNDWGGIYLLLLLPASLSLVRLCLAPYWIYKETHDKFATYEKNTVEVQVLDNGDGLITIRMFNRTEKVQRLRNAYLKLVGCVGDTGVFNRVSRRADPFPIMLEPDDSVDVEFDTFTAELQLGRVASFCAEVELANGRTIQSETVRLPAPLPGVAMLPGSLKDRIDRSIRIKDFVANIKYLFYAYEDVKGARTLFRFEEAEVRQLADDSEVREACEALTEQGIPHPFAPWDLAPATNTEGVDILEFYRAIKREGMDLSQSKGDVYFQVWRQQQIHLLRLNDKAVALSLEPESSTGPELDHPSTQE